MKRKGLVLDRAETSVNLWGRRAAERYDDSQLAQLAELPNLDDLVLHRQSITRLPAGMKKVTRLRLGEMEGLTSLDGIEQLVGLRQLTLAALPNLDLARTFEQLAELPELDEIDLQGANLHTLPAAIAKLPSLLDISLTDCPDLDLETAFELLGELPFLRALQLIQRSRMELPDVFSPLHQVKRLELLFHFPNLPPTIGDMASLEELLGDRNHFASIPVEFGKLTKLRVLQLPDSKIKVIPDQLCKCTALEILDLRSNREIKKLPERIGDLVNLRELTIYGTKIKALPDSIAKLSNLRVLKINDAIETLPEAAYGLRLTELMAGEAVSARFTLLDAEIPDEDDLQLFDSARIPASFGQPLELDLNLELTEPLTQLEALTRVKSIELDVDRLEYVIPHLAKLTTLEHLQIELREGVSRLPASLSNVTSLVSLTLVGELESLPDLSKLPLTSLVIHKCKLRELDPAMLPTLVRLTVTSDDIHELPASIGRLTMLETLELKAPIAALPDELVNCTALHTLELSRSWGDQKQLESYEVLAKLPALRSLSLRGMRVDLKKLCTALAHKPLELLELSGANVREKLGAQIGLLDRVVEIDLDNVKLAEISPELAHCTALRKITFGAYRVPPDIKKFLPEGRWRKANSRGKWTYERTDV